ncbi:unnamed protein product, partial [Notodromas monacha]
MENLRSFFQIFTGLKNQGAEQQCDDAVDEFLQSQRGTLQENALLIITRGERNVIPRDMDKNLIKRVLQRTKVCVDQNHPKIKQLTLERKREIVEMFFDERFTGLSVLACDAFSLPEAELNTFYKKKVCSLLSARQYVMASEWMTGLEIPYGIYEKVIAPLGLLPDTENILYQFLSRFKQLRPAVIENLDELILLKPIELEDRCRECGVSIDNVRPEKSLSQLLRFWCTEFDIDFDRVARRSACQAHKLALDFFFGKTYISRQMSVEAFVERVESLLRDHDSLREWFVLYLERKNKLTEAAFWLTKYRLDFEQFSAELKKKIWANSAGITDRTELNMDSALFHPLRLQEKDVIHIEDTATFRKVMEVILQKSTIAVDCEWLSTSRSSKKRISILQIAGRSQIFLFDILALENILSRDYRTILAKVFEAPSILKICYNFDEKIELISQLVGVPPDDFAKRMHNVFDIRDFFLLSRHMLLTFDEKLNDQDLERLFFPHSEGTNPDSVGLAGMVELLLGKPLDVRESMSDWERRPLRPAQVQFAALSAFCLYEIYDALEQKARKWDVDFKIMFEWFSITETGATLIESFHVDNGDELESIFKVNSGIADRNRLTRPNAARNDPRIRPLKVRELVVPEEDFSRNPIREVVIADASGRRLRIQDDAAPAQTSIEPYAPVVPVQNPDQQPVIELRRKIRPEQLKVVTDLMLQGLCKQLLKLGVDAKTLKNPDPRIMCLEFSRKENRIILTRSGKGYDELKHKIEKKFLVAIETHNSMEQVLEVVRKMNLDISEAEIKRRCPDLFDVPSAGAKREQNTNVVLLWENKMKDTSASETCNGTDIERLNAFLESYAFVKQEKHRRIELLDAVLSDLPNSMLENALYIVCRGRDQDIGGDQVMNKQFIVRLFDRVKFHMSNGHPKCHPLSSSRKKDVFALFSPKRFRKIVPLVCCVFSLVDDTLSSFYEFEISKMIEKEEYMLAVLWITELKLSESSYEPLLVPLALSSNSDVVLRTVFDERESLRMMTISQLDKLVELQPGQYSDVSVDAFVERVRRIIHGSQSLASWFVNFLQENGKISEASFWAAEISPSQNLYSAEVEQMIRLGDLGFSDRKELFVDPSLFHALRIDEANIVFVGDIFTYRNVMKVLLEKTLLGLDCEWLPTYGESEKRLSIFQISTETEVFILDMLHMKSFMDGKDGVLLANLFSSSTVMKLCYGFKTDFEMFCGTGYGFKTDFEMLHQLGGPLANIASESKNMFDVHAFQILARQILRNQVDLNSHQQRYGRMLADFFLKPGKEVDCYDFGQPVTGLASLVRTVLGKPLDKRE